MPRAKNKSRKIGATPSGLMKEAVEQIIENKASIRNVSEEYAIPFTTLWRYVLSILPMLFLNQDTIIA